jgi:hypothetical protein
VIVDVNRDGDVAVIAKAQSCPFGAGAWEAVSVFTETARVTLRVGRRSVAFGDSA